MLLLIISISGFLLGFFLIDILSGFKRLKVKNKPKVIKMKYESPRAYKSMYHRDVLSKYLGYKEYITTLGSRLTSRSVDFTLYPRTLNCTASVDYYKRMCNEYITVFNLVCKYGNDASKCNPKTFDNLNWEVDKLYLIKKHDEIVDLIKGDFRRHKEFR